MRVLQFAFGGDPTTASCRTTTSPTRVVYTGTHDNDTTRGWFAQAPEPRASFVTSATSAASNGDATTRRHRLGPHSARPGSVADTAIVPLQDVLNLGSEARMNIPGATGSSWMWRSRRTSSTPPAPIAWPS